LRETFAFQPGQFLTLRSQIDGQDVRRSYSICCAQSRLVRDGELEIGIRPMDGGVFSNWAATRLKSGDTLAVMPPDGRFTSKRPRALHRVGFAAGSGITPILSIMASTLEEQPGSKFTPGLWQPAHGQRDVQRGPAGSQGPLPGPPDTDPRSVAPGPGSGPATGRIDGDKVRAIIATLLPVGSMDEVFICGPEAMIEATESALLEAGVPRERVHTERFTSPTLESLTPDARKAAIHSHAPVAEGSSHSPWCWMASPTKCG
jgi:ring-1,2-phenylacetyl-CoA epoxidase subunit PaaE